MSTVWQPYIVYLDPPMVCEIFCEPGGNLLSFSCVIITLPSIGLDFADP
jgi:hypothetical protein